MLGITGKNGFPAPSGAVRGDFSVELVFGATESPALNFSAVSLSITHRGSWRVGPPPFASPPRRGPPEGDGGCCLGTCSHTLEYDLWHHHYRLSEQTPVTAIAFLHLWSTVTLAPSHFSIYPHPCFSIELRSSIENQHPNHVCHKLPICDTCSAEGRSPKVSKVNNPGLAVRRYGWVGLSFP